MAMRSRGITKMPSRLVGSASRACSTSMPRVTRLVWKVWEQVWEQVWGQQVWSPVRHVPWLGVSQDVQGHAHAQRPWH